MVKTCNCNLGATNNVLIIGKEKTYVDLENFSTNPLTGDVHQNDGITYEPQALGKLLIDPLDGGISVLPYELNTGEETVESSAEKSFFDDPQNNHLEDDCSSIDKIIVEEESSTIEENGFFDKGIKQNVCNETYDEKISKNLRSSNESVYPEDLDERKGYFNKNLSYPPKQPKKPQTGYEVLSKTTGVQENTEISSENSGADVLTGRVSIEDQIVAFSRSPKNPLSLRETVALLGPGNALKEDEKHDAKNTPKEDITPYDCMVKLIKLINFKNVDDALYYYNQICYKHVSHEELSRLIVGTIRYDVSKPTGYTNFPQDTRRWLMMEPSLVCSPMVQTHLVAFRNGVLNLNTGIFTEPSPDYFITSYVDADYDVNASENTPIFDAFLYKSFDGNPALIQRVWEVLGYLLTSDMNAKVFILLQGVPNSGKSVLGRFISSFFDSSTTSSVDIFTLGERFAVYNLVGKRINASLDLPAGKLSQQAVSVIKQLTGNDPLTAEAKYENSFKFENTCKLVFATNHPICLAESDEAFENRCLVVPFRHSVPKCEQDFHLLEKFNFEKPGIIKKALQSYQILRANSYVFSGEEYVKMNYKEFMSEDKIVKQFIDLCCEFTGLGEGTFTCILYDKYANYCNLYGYPTITSIVKFSETLKRICGDKISAAKWREKAIKDGPQNGYRGIKIK